MTLKSDKHYVTICVGTYIQGCYFSCIAYYRNKGNRKKRRGLFQSMDPRLVSADGLEKPLILSYFIKKMRMCPTISSTSSMPRATNCRPHQIQLTAVAQPDNVPILANKYQFLLSLVCLQFYTLTMEEKRKSRQISPTKSKPREEKIEEAQEETKPFQTNQSVLFRHISFLQSVQKGTACVCWDCAESLHCVVELHVM